MSSTVQVSVEDDAIVVRIPLKVRKRGGRKLLVAAGPVSAKANEVKTDETILKALGRAHRWKRMLESGEVASIGDLAVAEKINHSYIRRILRLTLLSPEITGKILDGKQPRNLQLQYLESTPIDWSRQNERFLAK